MNILLVNDDGYESTNLILLKEELKKYGKVVVVAPNKVMSGKSIATTIHEHLKVEKIDEDLYAIYGTPADCVIYGLNSLGIKFDLVCSGINFGSNITYDIMHSGTIGACVEALMYNVPAIAFSGEKYFEENAKYIGSTMDFILKHDLLSKDEYFLNVNFPTSKTNKGIVFSRLSYRNDIRYFKDNGEELIPTREVDDPNKYPKDSDVYLVENEYISVTPLLKSLFSDELFNRLKKEKNL